MSRTTLRISQLIPPSSAKRTSIAAVLMLLLVATSVEAAHSGVTASEAFDCKFQTAGRSFDLTPLSGPWSHTTEPVDISPSTSKANYALSICEPLPRNGVLADRDQCPEGTRACFTIINSKEGEPDRITTVVPVAGGVGSLDANLAFTGKGGKETRDKLSVALHAGKYLDRTRWANLTFFCDASSESKEPTSWSYKRTETEGVLSVEFANKFACPLNSQGQPDPNGDGTSRAKQGSGVVAFFRNFVFFLFILLIAYFVFGAYNQYSQYGSRGWDLIPHRAFWADLPYVLQDLFRGNGRNSGGYSSL